MSPPSSLLTLPLEVRQRIYSYLLINKYPAHFPWRHWNYSVCCLSRTSRHLYHEVLHYYYTKNVFWLSFVFSECLPTERPAWPKKSKKSKKWTESLEINLKRAPPLQLELKLEDNGQSDLQQLEQLEWFYDALIRAKQRSVEKCWLKSLDIQVCKSRSQDFFGYYPAKQVTDEEMALYKAILQPLRGRIGKLMIFGRQLTLDDEDLSVDQD